MKTKSINYVILHLIMLKKWAGVYLFIKIGSGNNRIYSSNSINRPLQTFINFKFSIEDTDNAEMQLPSDFFILSPHSPRPIFVHWSFDFVIGIVGLGLIFDFKCVGIEVLVNTTIDDLCITRFGFVLHIIAIVMDCLPCG